MNRTYMWFMRAYLKLFKTTRICCSLTPTAKHFGYFPVPAKVFKDVFKHTATCQQTTIVYQDQ